MTVTAGRWKLVTWRWCRHGSLWRRSAFGEACVFAW